MQNNQNLEEKFSENPEENLRIENDILKLKLHATYGADMYIGPGKDLPPEIENEFLKNVIAFEEAMENEEVGSLYDKVGRPAYKAAADLTDEEITTELARLHAVMNDHDIQLDVLGKYDNRTIYSFITEELFVQEVITGCTIPGFTYHFIYEEFHPNHEYDIDNRVREFLSDWFERKFDEYSFEFSDPLIIADGRTMKKEDLLNKLKVIFDSYVSFSEEQFSIDNISYQLNEEEGNGMGYAEGNVKYYATLEDGQQILIGGPFKFYLSFTEKWWQIFYYVFPGFEW